MDLASIPAGENDIEIDRLKGFQEAVSGYSPLLYSLPETAGFEELLDRAQEVWDTLQKDEKLPEKLVSFCLEIHRISSSFSSHTLHKTLRLLALDIYTILRSTKKYMKYTVYKNSQ